jgi:O-antigen/teichoic acid export membrane protein
MAIDSNEKNRLMRDGTIHALGLVLSSLAGLVLVPVMVRGLGFEAYGLWASATAAVGIAGAFDLGLRLMIVADLAGEVRSERAPAVRMMLWIHVGIGIASGTAIALGGIGAAKSMHLSPAAQALAPTVFALSAGTCFVDQVFAYVLSVLAGLRRFDVLNLLSVGISLVRLALFLTAIGLGKGVLTIAGLQLLTSVSSVVAGMAFIHVAAKELRPRWERLRWESLRERLGFGALSQAATSIASLQMPISTLLISVINGAAAVTPFTIGQKFPALASGLSWRTAEVFFPLASRQRHGAEIDGEAFLGTVSRWLMLVITPCALGLFMIAPMLLRTWMGEVDPVALAVLRIASLSVVVETLIPGAVQLFWGAGETGPVLSANVATAVVDVALALLLLPRVGAPGAAWATLVSTLFAVALLTGLAAHRRGIRWSRVLKQMSSRLFPVLLVSLLPAFLLAHMVTGRSWVLVVGIAAVSALLYLVMLWWFAASEEEKQFLGRMLRDRDKPHVLVSKGTPREG